MATTLWTFEESDRNWTLHLDLMFWILDTSAMNIFLNDESFRKIVLGENYFKITGMDKQGYRAPEMCISQSPIDSIHSSASALSSPIDVLRRSLIFTSQSILKLLFQLLSISKVM